MVKEKESGENNQIFQKWILFATPSISATNLDTEMTNASTAAGTRMMLCLSCMKLLALPKLLMENGGEYHR